MNAAVHIRTTWKNDSTSLANAYCTPPYKVADITENRSEPVLRLMLMSSSPGILDGDNHTIKVEVGEKCRLSLQTQSYQRLFAMKKSARQQMEVYVAAGASFGFIPQPVVPHAASHFLGRNKIFLFENSVLMWGEVLTCGRKLCGEIFQYFRYHVITEIFINERLVVKENLFLEPGMKGFHGIGQREGFSHQASFIFINANANVVPVMEDISEWLASQPEITFGISAAPHCGFVVRLLGRHAEKLYECLKVCQAYAE